MKTLSNDEKIRIMNEGIEPFMRKLSPDVIASCIASTLRVYMNSSEYINDGVEMKASVVLSTGLTKLFDVMVRRLTYIILLVAGVLLVGSESDLYQ